MKYKIAFFLNNEDISDADLSSPDKGNPGVGGTKFLISALPHYLQKFYKEGIEVALFANQIDKLPKSVDRFTCSSICEALEDAEGKRYDFFVYRPVSNDLRQGFYESLEHKNISAIAWGHNTPDYKTLSIMTKASQLRAFVCVSQEQQDRLRDHPIFYKSVTIFNGFDLENFIPKESIPKVPNSVAYLGALVPAKGFHKLAEVWPKVIEKCPNAQLLVMGSGNLYNSRLKLGKWGIAEEFYEKKFRKYLSDQKGNVLPSVKFLGLVKEGKAELLESVTVGVVNPTGKSENCPGSALEFQAVGTPVVSGAYKGLLDTVIDNETGLLGKGHNDLTNNIIKLLEDQDLRSYLSKNGPKFVNEKFNYQDICKGWYDLFVFLNTGKTMQYSKFEKFPNSDFKWLRELLRNLKSALPIFKIIPPLISAKSFLRELLVRK